MKNLALLCLLTSVAGAQQVAASLTALDPIVVLLRNVVQQTVLAAATHPAGPVTSPFHGQVPGARYSCTLTSLAAGVQLTARTDTAPRPNHHEMATTHVDILLILTGTGTVSIELQLDHIGDGATSAGFSVDFGHNGSVEISTAGGSPIHHRFWTWNFANGALPIRIRTDDIGVYGAQSYQLSLFAAPWVSRARPAAAGCTHFAEVADPQDFRRETSNYQLAALPPTHTHEIAVFRAAGMGAFDVFLVGISPNTAIVQAPAPFITPSVPLLGSLFLFPGQVTSRTTVGIAGLPRTWEFSVPWMPPGLTFYVQQASATLDHPHQLGTTNVIRFDT